MIKSKIISAFRRIRRVVGLSSKDESYLNYWERRAKQYGRKAVFNISHSDEELENVTKNQKDIIYPWFLGSLKGDEQVVLDLGCGTGRFTSDLADMINGYAIGIDPIKELIDLAPHKSERVTYMQFNGNTIPLENLSVDIIWICLVLGGLSGNDFLQITNEIERVLKTGGLLFLIENTSQKTNGKYWYFRSVNEYQGSFQSINLKNVATYEDLDEKISIMIGNKVFG
jgi:ubiquinone/menaquinone biosynthesis C-methylase UbiE